MRSKSWPSGLLSNWKLACSTCSWSSVKVVLTRFAFDFWLHSESKKILIIISTLYRRTEARKNRGRGTEVLVHSLKKCIFFFIYRNKKLTPKSAGPSTSCLAHSFKKNDATWFIHCFKIYQNHRNHPQKKIWFALYDDVMCYLCLSPPLAAPYSDSYTGPCPRVERTPPPWTADAYSYRTQNRPSGRRSPWLASPSPSTG